MKLSLKAELILSFTALGMVSIGIIFVFVNFFLESQFREYSMRKQELANRELANVIERQYYGTSLWHTNVIEQTGIRALEQGLILKVTNNRGETVWDALEYNSGICHTMIEKMAVRMTARYPSISGGLTYKDYPLASAGNAVGNLRVGYYGPFFYTDSDFFFIDTINRMLVWLGIATLAASIIAGIIISGRIASPIAHAIRLARRIQEGDFTDTPYLRSPTKEVAELVATMGTLAKTLGEQESLRRRLTQDVAHELRTPLTTLQSHFEAMIDGVWEPSKERLFSCHSEVMRLAELVRNIQTLTSYESEAYELEKTEFDALALAKRLLILHEPDMRIKEIKSSLSASGDMDVFADRDRIAEVLGNIIENATEFTPSHGSIDVKLERNGDDFIIRVKDSGEGIPEEDLPFIFERFYRVDKSRARTRGGAGIGLAIVKQIVSAHCGTVGAASVFGQGSEFTVVLPQ